MMRQLDSTKTDFLKERIESTWDITDHYWYPLDECKHNDERFWFSEDMSWIIYVSHEGSITFGGEELLNQVKSKSDTWQSKIFAPEYNQAEDE